MKKTIWLFILGLLLITPVNALENRLYVTGSDYKLAYDSKLIDENVFMKHIDMIPGDSYTDELIIENNSSLSYDLYFKVIPKNMNAPKRVFFNNISMKIYLDDNLVYDGGVDGMDYQSSGVNLQDSVLLGTFPVGRVANMRVETSLSEDYSDTNFSDNAFIDWTFYAQFDGEINPNPDTGGHGDDEKPDKPVPSDPVEILPIPDTGILGGSSKNYIPSIIIGGIVLLLFVFYYNKKGNKQKLRR